MRSLGFFGGKQGAIFQKICKCMENAVNKRKEEKLP